MGMYGRRYTAPLPPTRFRGASQSHTLTYGSASDKKRLLDTNSHSHEDGYHIEILAHSFDDICRQFLSTINLWLTHHRR